MTQPSLSNNPRSQSSESESIAYSAPSNLSATALNDSTKNVDNHPFEGYVVIISTVPILSTHDSVTDLKLYYFSLLIHGARASYHPWNVYLLMPVVWVALIAIEIVLMERSVALAPTTTSLPWYHSTSGLPSVLNTIFAQGHGVVTTIRLSRLFVSALDSHRIRPRTWLEMFWTANQTWSGPVSILTTGLKIIKLRVRVSALAILFTLLSIIAIVTPVALEA